MNLNMGYGTCLGTGDKPAFKTVMTEFADVYMRHQDSMGWVVINKYDNEIYRQTSNVSRAKSQNLNISRLVFQLSLPNPLKPGV